MKPELTEAESAYNSAWSIEPCDSDECGYTAERLANPVVPCGRPATRWLLTKWGGYGSVCEEHAAKVSVDAPAGWVVATIMRAF